MSGSLLGCQLLEGRLHRSGLGSTERVVVRARQPRWSGVPVTDGVGGRCVDGDGPTGLEAGAVISDGGPGFRDPSAEGHRGGGNRERVAPHCSARVADGSGWPQHGKNRRARTQNSGCGPSASTQPRCRREALWRGPHRPGCARTVRSLDGAATPTVGGWSASIAEVVFREVLASESSKDSWSRAPAERSPCCTLAVHGDLAFDRQASA